MTLRIEYGGQSYEFDDFNLKMGEHYFRIDLPHSAVKDINFEINKPLAIYHNGDLIFDLYFTAIYYSYNPFSHQIHFEYTGDFEENYL